MAPAQYINPFADTSDDDTQARDQHPAFSSPSSPAARCHVHLRSAGRTWSSDTGECSSAFHARSQKSCPAGALSPQAQHASILRRGSGSPTRLSRSSDGGNALANVGEQKLPLLHQACYRGALDAVKAALDGGNDDLNIAVDLLNSNGRGAIGVTPLYLAAQGGHLQICRLLVEAGADTQADAIVPHTGEALNPTDIALLQMHLRTWWFLQALPKPLPPRTRIPFHCLFTTKEEQQLAQPLLGGSTSLLEDDDW